MRWVMDEIRICFIQRRETICFPIAKKMKPTFWLNPGKQYALYFPKGGEVTLDLSSASGLWEIKWRNVLDGTIKMGNQLKGDQPFC
jgi:hypothetical protein